MEEFKDTAPFSVRAVLLAAVYIDVDNLFISRELFVVVCCSYLAVGTIPHDLVCVNYFLVVFSNNSSMYSLRLGMLTGTKNKICQECDQLCAGMPVNLDPYKQELLERIKGL